MTHPTHFLELVEAVARALDPGIFTMADQDKKVGATHSAFLEQRIESTLRLARYALTAAEPFIAARVDVAVEAATALETLTARIAELEAERAWRPIETAPRDGTMFLARGKVYGNIPFACHWDVAPLHPNGSWINSLTKSRLYDHVPAHWQPLPPLPTPETGDG